jgi:RNA polymerase sigma factor (sigma-70 family)
MSKNRYGGVDSYAAFFITYKAKTLTRSPFFTADDFEDLQQELMLAYLHAWPKFDESKGNPKSFIKAVVNNCAGMIIREAESQMRWTGQKDMSLSTIVGGDDSTMEMIELITGDHSIWGDPFDSSSHQAAELNMDIQKLLAEMPEDIRMTYELLKDHSITEAAKLTGIPRTTLSSKAQRLRQYLEEWSLKEKN